MCGCVGVWVISRVFSGYCFYDRTLFFSRWDFPLRQTVNSTFTYLTYYNESPRYTYIFFPSLHFTPLQVSNQPFTQLQIPHPQPDDYLRTQYAPQYHPSPTPVYPPPTLKAQAVGKKPFNSAPNCRICETTYESSAHERKYTPRVPFL